MSEFWGLLIEPGKDYNSDIPSNLRLTMATFGEDTVAGTKTKLYAKIDETVLCLCTLIEEKHENQLLDTNIPSGKEVIFYVTGPNSVYIHGELIEEEYDDYSDSNYDEEEEISDSEDDIYNSDDDSEELEFEEDRIEEIDSDEEIKPKAIAKKGAVPEAVKVNDFSNGAKQKKPKDEQKADKRKPETEKVPEAKKGKSEAQKMPEAKKAKAETQKKVESSQGPTTRTLPGGLVVYDHKMGSGAEAKSGNRISVHYIGKLKNGKVFDKSEKPFSFKIGAGQVIKGWEAGCVGLKIGGERRLTIPPALAYGKRGAPPDIPKNATLTFEIKCVSIRK